MEKKKEIKTFYELIEECSKELNLDKRTNYYKQLRRTIKAVDGKKIRNTSGV